VQYLLGSPPQKCSICLEVLRRAVTLLLALHDQPAEDEGLHPGMQ